MATGGWSPDALTAYLKGLDADETYMTFAELDAVAGRFPDSARTHNAYWADSVTGHAHARGWLDAGFLATPQFVEGRVWFHRGVPRSPAGRRSTGQTVKTSTAVTPELERTGEEYCGEIAYGWLDAGEISLTNARLGVPIFGVTPGVYRFTLLEAGGDVRSYYVGESENLFQRMNGYRNPGPTQATNQRINRILQDLLEDGGSVRVAVVLEATLDGDHLDLAHRSARLLVENSALLHLATEGAVVENLRTGS